MQVTLWQTFNVMRKKTRRTINFVKGAACILFSSSSHATLYSHPSQSESPNWLLCCIAKWDCHQPQWYPTTSSGQLSSSGSPVVHCPQLSFLHAYCSWYYVTDQMLPFASSGGLSVHCWSKLYSSWRVAAWARQRGYCPSHHLPVGSTGWQQQ